MQECAWDDMRNIKEASKGENRKQDQKGSKG